MQAGRQIRFTDAREIVEMETILKTYIHETIEVEKAGLEVNFKKNTEFVILHFSQPKQSKTRASRVEKWLQQILNGKGLKD